MLAPSMPACLCLLPAFLRTKKKKKKWSSGRMETRQAGLEEESAETSCQYGGRPRERKLS